MRAGKAFFAGEMTGDMMDIQGIGKCDNAAGVISGFPMRLTITYYGNRINS